MFFSYCKGQVLYISAQKVKITYLCILAIELKAAAVMIIPNQIAWLYDSYL
jgi:hypothetical protein